MKIARNDAEREQIQQVLRENPSFANVFRRDWTKIVVDDLNNRLYGKIPRNFLLNITGLIGVPTGIFKSSMGLQLALMLDPNFNIQQRVAFSVNQLLEKLESYSEYSLCNKCFIEFTKTSYNTYEFYPTTNAEKKCDNCDSVSQTDVLLTKMIFFLDEQTKTLRTGNLMRLSNIVDTNRQRQICFITCGVDQYDMHFTTYNLKRVQESSDLYLPQKKVRYAVYDDSRKIFYGFFDWNIRTLEDKGWFAVWSEYSKLKTNFQRIAIAQQIQTMKYEDMANEVINDADFQKCFFMKRDGQRNMVSDLVRTLIQRRYPDLTENDRRNILSEIKFMMFDEQEATA
jgi:hypothetical protein